MSWLYVELYPSVGGLPPLLLAVRFFGAVAVLFVPTFLMGGTLPILARVIARNTDELGGRCQPTLLGQYSRCCRRNIVVRIRPSSRIWSAWNYRHCSSSQRSFPVCVAFKIPTSLRHQQVLKNSDVVTPSPVLVPQPSSTPLLFLFAVVGCTAFTYEIAWTRLLSSHRQQFHICIHNNAGDVSYRNCSRERVFSIFRSSLGKNLARHFLQNAKRGSELRRFHP